MIFSSASFLLFFSIVAFIHWFILPRIGDPQRRLRTLHIFLLVASYFFYMSWDWRFGFLIAFSTLVDYLAGRYMHRADERAKSETSPDATRNAARVRRLALIISVITNLGILGFFKYTDFFIASFVDFANCIHPQAFSPADKDSLLLKVILPLGISFFTFQSMSYTIDVYRRVIPAEKDFVRFALYVSFFPQLVAGPIVVAKDFLPQLQQLPEFDLQRLRVAARWFALGYLKKTLLADNMAPVVDAIYKSPDQYGLAGHWLGALGFWVQVYGDFSGYSDMAWGTAIFLGYHLPENFRLPYLSRSPAEHWRRWHISLIRWIRDYLYIPLGGNRVSFWRHKFNVFLTMFLAGVWHGANWTFVIWGAIHGLLLTGQTVFNELLAKFRTRGGDGDLATASAAGPPFAASLFRLMRGLRTALFILGTSFCTVYFGTIFRSPDIKTAWLILQRMVGLQLHNAPLPGVTMYRPVLLGVLTVIIGHLLGYYIFERKREIRIPAWLEIALAPVIILLFIQIGASGDTPFIYFVF